MICNVIIKLCKAELATINGLYNLWVDFQNKACSLIMTYNDFGTVVNVGKCSQFGYINQPMYVKTCHKYVTCVSKLRKVPYLNMGGKPCYFPSYLPYHLLIGLFSNDSVKMDLYSIVTGQ